MAESSSTLARSGSVTSWAWAVTAPIIGPRTMEQLTQSLRSLELKLDADALKRLDDIWPGPGGEAPEAYAW